MKHRHRPRHGTRYGHWHSTLAIIWEIIQFNVIISVVFDTVACPIPGQA
jgi:hypothetical protein